MRAKEFTLNEGSGARLGDLATVGTNMPDADFWIIRRGSEKTVGTPVKEFNPERIGVKVTRRDVIDPGYLYYAMMHLHNQGYFAQRSIGTTNLVNIRTADVAGISFAQGLAEGMAQDEAEEYSGWRAELVNQIKYNTFEVKMTNTRSKESANFIVRPVDMISHGPTLAIETMDVHDLQTGRTESWTSDDPAPDGPIVYAISGLFYDNKELQKLLWAIVDQSKDLDLMPGLDQRRSIGQEVDADDYIDSQQKTQAAMAKMKKGVAEAFDNPYKGKWEKSESGSYDMLVPLPDGTNLSIMFNNEGGGEYQVEFYRNNSQEVTGEGDAQRIFATVLNAIQKFIKKHKPLQIGFSASKEVKPGQNSKSRAKLYTRLVDRYAAALGYDARHFEHGNAVSYELTQYSEEPPFTENFHDGRNPQDKGDSKRHGINTKASVSSLRKTAKHSSGRKQELAHWMANMKAGRAKANKK